MSRKRKIKIIIKVLVNIIIFSIIIALSIKAYNRGYALGSSLWDDFYIRNASKLRQNVLIFNPRAVKP